MLTKDEAELYDRQIRLWGVNAQSLIRQSKVMMLGFGGVASEIAKTLVLAGIDTLTIVDDQPLQDSDPYCNLFCRPSSDVEFQDKVKFRTHAVKTKLRELNPLVKVNIDTSTILSKKMEEFAEYDLVSLHSFLTTDQISDLNDKCRKVQTKFYIVLDYGFFGFMFNDLGAEFKFTHDQFNVKPSPSQDGEKRQSGEKKDPIVLSSIEEPMEEATDDTSITTSDDESSRPKKKRRLVSPAREAAVKSEDEKQTKITSIPYVTFRELISLEHNFFNKNTSPILLISIAMFKFYSKYNYLPRCDSDQVRESDISILNEIIVSLKDSLNLHEAVFKRLDKDWSENIYDNLSPICAVLGGVAGQDMIRALSKRDIPISNTFAFDGLSMNGVVERVGIADSKDPKPQPVVRDFIQMDDDD